MPRPVGMFNETPEEFVLRKEDYPLSDLTTAAEIFTPYGDVVAVQDAIEAAKQGNYGESLFHAATTVPAVGDALKYVAPAIFGGMRALKAPDSPALWDAVEEGVSNKELWDEFGWFKQSGKMKWEIDDSPAAFDQTMLKTTPTINPSNVDLEVLPSVADVFKHDELYANYPMLEDYRIAFVDGAEYKGSHDVNNQLFLIDRELLKKPEALKKTMLHELQHAVQTVEEWQNGAVLGNFMSESALDTIKDGMRNASDAFQKAGIPKEQVSEVISNPMMFHAVGIASEGLDPTDYFRMKAKAHGKDWTDEDIKHMADVAKEFGDLAESKMDIDSLADLQIDASFTGNTYDKAYAGYLSMVGEVEARNTAFRFNLSEGERKAKFPLDSQDVRPEDIQEFLPSKPSDVFAPNPFKSTIK